MSGLAAVERCTYRVVFQTLKSESSVLEEWPGGLEGKNRHTAQGIRSKLKGERIRNGLSAFGAGQTVKGNKLIEKGKHAGGGKKNSERNQRSASSIRRTRHTIIF